MNGNLDERLRRLIGEWKVFLDALPDGAYKGLGELRLGFSVLESALAALPEAASDERLKAALQASVIALDDWLHEYAPELCGEPYVTETRERIASRGGTLAYIAKVQQENRAALAALPEASETPLEKYFRDRFNTEWTPELEQELLEKIAAKQKAAVPEASEPRPQSSKVEGMVGALVAYQAAAPLAQQHTHTPDDPLFCCVCKWTCTNITKSHESSEIRKDCAAQHAEHVREVSK